jgi:hypothetical protein
LKYDSNVLFTRVFPRFFTDVADVQSSEANYAALLYHHMISGGLSHKQICTEMYSANLIKDGTRPDLVVFDEGIDGRFNYFKDCEKSQSNTPLKLDKLRCVIEIKGGAQQAASGLGKYLDYDPLCKNLLSDPRKRQKTQNCSLPLDIEKLGVWASHFGDTLSGRDYVFLALDMKNPKGFWQDSIRDTFGGYCAHHGVHLVYYAQGASHYWHYNVSERGEQCPLI